MTGNDLRRNCGQTDSLARFLRSHSGLFVLTGAGCSTDSGIPDYRDGNGQWKRAPPMDIREFSSSTANRKRYWARSMVGWRHVGRAIPNAAHRALEKLERAGLSKQLVTQNVDGLHQRAGSRRVIDLHGRLDHAICLGCGAKRSRQSIQKELVDSNPGFGRIDARTAPDGDADLTGLDFEAFRIPSCGLCGGTLKPDVVFFGESVPKHRVRMAMDALECASALLVVGSSLTVFSGYRFALRAAELGKPIATLNLGRTRADHLLSLRVRGPCSEILPSAIERAVT